MDYKTIIGANLQAARKEKKIGQKDVAAHMNVGVSTVSMWEIGGNTMSVEQFVEYCDFLDVSLDTIAGRIPDGIEVSEMDLLRKFKSIDETQQQMIRASLETAYNNSKKGNAAVSA